MSKEQTPITAEEFFNNGGDIIESCFGTKYSKTDLNPIKFAEQYAQYRERKAVLEALEKEFNIVSFMLPNGIPLIGNIEYVTGIQYYNEVIKPKYFKLK